MPVLDTPLLLSPDAPTLATRYDKAGDPFGVRPYHLEDRPALEDFYGDFEPIRAAQGLPPQGRARVTRWLDAVLGHGLHLVALRDDLLIGHALVVPVPDPGVGEYAVFLHQGERGRGVGIELSRAAIEAARDSGLQRLWLTVEPHNRAAIGAYERVGFRFRSAAILSPEAEMTLDLHP
jgi:RimJ/RimL family protein N-acetyltransferase